MKPSCLCLYSGCYKSKVKLWFFFILLTISCFINSTKAQTNHPNVILILSDDIGYNTLGVNGGTVYKTPNLDTMAMQGMNFSQCHASPLCSPSRFMLLTGKQNFRNYTQWGLMDTSQRTISNMFKDAGYKTACYGKWQLDGGDVSVKKFGFDNYCIYDPFLSSAGSRYKNPEIYTNGNYVADSLTLNKYGEDIFTDSVLNFIDNNKTSPFFIYYPMVLAHSPFQPTPDDTAFANWNSTKASDTGFYSSMISYMDKKVGEILNKIKNSDIANNTIIIFLGDNGSPPKISHYINDETSGGKGSTYETGLRVPLIVYWQGTVSTGTLNNDVIGLTDFLPTLADLINTSVPDYGPLDGESFAPQIRGTAGTPRDWLFYHYNPYPNKDTLKRWAQTLQYKLYDTSAANNTRLFYNIVNDPNENNPIPDSSLTADEIIIKQHLLDVINGYISEGLPLLNTPKVFSVTDSSATIKDSIILSGGSTIIASGVVWGTDHDPVLSDSNYTSDNAYKGKFNSFINRLNSSATYYVRTYAKNAAGTAYSEETIVNTLPASPLCTEADSVTNRSFIANWDSLTEATNYKLDVSTSPSFPPDSFVYKNLNVTGNAKLISNLKKNTQYYYCVRAVNANGVSANSNIISVFTTNLELDTPVCINATRINKSSFVANWNAVNSASSYKIDVSTDPTFYSSTPVFVNEDFSSGINPPEGWTFSDGLVTDTTAFGKASPSVRFNKSGRTITTPILATAANQFSFWIKGVSGNPGVLLVQGFDGSAWKTIDSIVNISKIKATKTYNASLTPSFQNNLIQFRLSYTKTTGSADVDDISVKYIQVAPSFIPGYADVTVLKDSLKISNLSNNTKYYYRVRAISSSLDDTSENSNTVEVITCSKPAISSITITNAVCSGDSSAAINIDAAGKALAYNWTGDNGFTSLSRDINNLSAGMYHLAVTSNGACEVDTAVEVTEPSAINATLNADSITCSGGTTTLTVNTSGGTGNYHYTLSDGRNTTGPQYEDYFTVGTGNYTVIVEDDNHCSFTTENITITEPPSITATLSADSIACSGGTTTLTVNASGGTGNYHYTLSDGTNTTGPQNENYFSVAAGNYKVIVEDDNHCSFATENITITEPTAINATLNADSITCSGGTATLTVNASGGTGNYHYTLSDGINTAGPQNENYFSVAAGNYKVIVEDDNHCSFTTENITIIEPTAINATLNADSITCSGGTTTLTVNASGGTGNYHYTLSNGTNTTSPQDENYFIVSAGNYTVIVEDGNHCSFTTENITVTEPPAIIATLNADSITCSGGTTTLTVNASGGTGNYHYTLSDGTNTTGPQDEDYFTVGAGNYTVIVEDDNHCSFTTDVLSINDGTENCSGITSGIATISAQNTMLKAIKNKQVSVNVFPNPAVNEFTLLVHAENNIKTRVLVTDLNGRKLYEFSGIGNANYVFGRSLAPGIYFAKIIQEDLIKTIKLIKTNR